MGLAKEWRAEEGKAEKEECKTRKWLQSFSSKKGRFVVVTKVIRSPMVLEVVTLESL